MVASHSKYLCSENSAILNFSKRKIVEERLQDIQVKNIKNSSKTSKTYKKQTSSKKTKIVQLPINRSRGRYVIQKVGRLGGVSYGMFGQDHAGILVRCSYVLC